MGFCINKDVAVKLYVLILYFFNRTDVGISISINPGCTGLSKEIPATAPCVMEKMYSAMFLEIVSTSEIACYRDLHFYHLAKPGFYYYFIY